MAGIQKALFAGVALVAASIGLPAWAQTRLFSENSEIQITIDGPLNTLIRASQRSTDPFPAVATVTPPGAAAERFDIQLSARGFSRRTGGICTFPPLRLGFDGTRGTFMQGQNRLKLVTRCRSGDNYEQITAREYTVYRLYNEITPLSYRVRPARVIYRDTDGRRREETQFNFLIEDLDDAARRNGRMVALDVVSNEVRSSQLDARQAAIYSLFQFMIGNLDFDMVSGHAGEECCHNSKLMAATAESRENVIPVPYDFDYSGFVNAPYAIPPEGVNVPNVRTRRYRGMCRHNEQLPEAIAHFQSRRAAIMEVISTEPSLNESSRRSASAYINEFYDLIGDPQRVTRQIVERCRG